VTWYVPDEVERDDAHKAVARARGEVMRWRAGQDVAGFFAPAITRVSEESVEWAYSAAMQRLDWADARIDAAGIEYDGARMWRVVRIEVEGAMGIIGQSLPRWWDEIAGMARDVASDVRDVANDVVEAAKSPLIGGGVGVLLGLALVVWLAWMR